MVQSCLIMQVDTALQNPELTEEFYEFDQPGRYIYLRDNETKDFWSTSWQPVGKALEEYKCECHHGTAYTKMLTDYSGIHSEVRYYVPLGQSHEVWSLCVENCSDREREISVTGYAEFTNNSNYEQDQVNLQYSQYITRTVFRGNRVRQMIHANLDRLDEGEKVDNKDVTNRFWVWPACQWIPGAVKKKRSWEDTTDMEIR